MAAPPKKPSETAFEGRKVDVNAGGFGEPVTKSSVVPKDATGRRHSSFPHLTPATPARAAHVTDVTHVDTVVGATAGKRFDIHQRFHQDDVVGSAPEFDRFIATDTETGRVHTVVAALNPSVHQARGAAPPVRGASLPDARRHALTFTVSPDPTDDPPLSPRTRARKVPDGY